MAFATCGLIPMPLKGKDIISLGDFGRKDIDLVLRTAKKLEPIAAKRRRTTLLKDKILATLFFEPSTRTRLSFEAAMQRLGGGVIGFADPKTSRAGDWRGETLEDTIKVVNQYADIIVMRNFIEGTAMTAAKVAEVPVINGSPVAVPKLMVGMDSVLIYFWNTWTRFQLPPAEI